MPVGSDLWTPPVQFGLHARSMGESAHPNLWQGLVSAICPAITGPGPFFDLIQPSYPHSVNGTVSSRLGPHGWGWGGTSPPTLYYPNSVFCKKFKLLPPMSIAYQVYWVGSGQHWITTNAHFGVPTVTARGMNFLLDNSSLVAYVIAGTNVAPASAPQVLAAPASGDITPLMNKWSTVVWSVDGPGGTNGAIRAATTKCYIDGENCAQNMADNAGSGTISQSVNQASIINGTITGGTNATPAWHGSILFWSRSLEHVECELLSTDIIAPFRTDDV